MAWTMLDAVVGVTGTSPSARSKHAITAVGTDIYLNGGRHIYPHLFGTMNFTMFRYSTITMEWTMLDAAAGVTGMSPSARWDHAMAAVGTDIYLFGETEYSGKGCHWWKGRGQTKGSAHAG